METISGNLTYSVDHSIKLHAGNAEPLLTFTTEGTIVLGPGLSDDEATARAASFLAEQYGRHITTAVKDAEAKLSIARQEADLLREQAIKNARERNAAEAKLAKAVEALKSTLWCLEMHRKVANPEWDGSAEDFSAIGKARTTLQGIGEDNAQ